MAYQFGLAKQLAAGGESLSELDLIADKSYVLNKHESMAERGFDLRVNQVMQDETPQADQTFSNINKTWPLGVVAVGLPDKRRISSITFRAFLGSPVIDGVLIVRRGAEPFYRRALGAISDVSDTTFDLTAAGMVPIDLFDMTVYTMSIVSQSGMDINLAGNNSDRPFYSWEFHELISEDMAYDSDLNPVVKGGIEGIEFDEAMSLHPGGDSTFQTDHVIEKISALVMHPVEDERAADRFMDVASRADDEPVFIVFADILTNPSFPFQVGDDARLLDVQVMSAGAQTNVMFKVFDQSSGKLVWSSMIGTMPSFGTVKIDFTDTTESNVPIDIFNSRVYTFDFSSEDGDVLLLGDDTPDPDQPWLTASFIPFFDETIAYLADLTSSTGVFNVDKSTTIPEENRDGTVFRPYKTINEALTDIGPATIDTQHTLILASADYDEDFTLPIFTHLLNPAHDPDSVHFNTVTVDEVGGQMSITRCRFDTLEYDTSGDATASTTVLSIVSSSIVNAVNITGRGAASDKIMIDQFDTFNTLDVTNILLIIQNSFSTAFAAALNFNATNAAINPLGGIECVIDIQSLTTPGAANSNMTSTLANLMFTAKNSVLPDYLVVGPNITIARDANTVFDISGPATIVNLDKSIQIDYGPNVVYVTKEEDFGTVVPATRIDVIPNTTFVLATAGLMQTLPFKLVDGTSMEILTLSRIAYDLTYTNVTEPQFQGKDVSIAFLNVVFNGNSTATLFDIDGGIISAKFPDFNRYDDLGTVRNLVDFFAPGVFFDVISEGLKLIDCSSSTFTDTLILGLDGNVFNMFTVSGQNSGDIQIIDNIMENDAFSSMIRVEPDYPTGKHITFGGNNVINASNTIDISGIDGTFTAVADASIASTTIDSVTDSGGKARFNFTVGPTVFVTQEVDLTGYVTNTDYNDKVLVKVAGVGFFETDIDFGSDEASGSFTSDSVTFTDTGTVLNDLDKVSIDTDFATDYDDGGVVYNKLTNSFQLNRIFTVTKAGNWSTRGLDQSNPKFLAANNAGSLASKYIATAFVNNNLTVNGAIVNNTFTDMIFGTGGSALVEGSTIERWKLIDEVGGIFEYFGGEPFNGSITFDFTVVSAGGTVDFRFKWVIDTGGGFVDLPDPVEALIAVGSEHESLSKTFPLRANKGDKIKPQITRNSGTSTITTEFATVYAIQ